MKQSIKPTVRRDGVRFVDADHFINGSPIDRWVCTNCGHTVTACEWGDQGHDVNLAAVEVTGGFYGPNGNGYNYWCRKCEGRMTPQGEVCEFNLQ